MKKKLTKYERDELDRKEGVAYDIGSAQLAKFRKVANKAGGVMELDRFYRVQYAEAVEQAVLASQRAKLRAAEGSTPRANCASGTFHNNADDLHRALQTQQRSALASCPSQVRRARGPTQWQSMYDEAMYDKRLAAMTPRERAMHDSALELAARNQRLAA